MPPAPCCVQIFSNPACYPSGRAKGCGQPGQTAGVSGQRNPAGDEVHGHRECRQKYRQNGFHVGAIVVGPFGIDTLVGFQGGFLEMTV